MKRPKYELADIFSRYWSKYKETHKTSPEQNKVVTAIQRCRTSKLGGHIEVCTNKECDYTTHAYNSCRNRNCPKCQGPKQLEWVRQRLLELLPIPYFHHVFTLPHILNPLALCNKEIIYDLFFKSCSYTLKAFSRDPKFLNAQLGFIGIIHTWGQQLPYHIHIHFIITGGGIAYDNSRFIRLPYQEKFMFPSEAMSRMIRGRFEKLLQKAYDEGKLRFPGELAEIKSPDAFKRFRKKVGQQAWYNYTKEPFAGPEQVVKYISRYTHRVAISNHRLLGIDKGQVTFRYKDYQDKDKHGIPKTKELTLSAESFIQRFLWHIVPSGFKKIRHYGFLSPGCRKEKLPFARSLLEVLSEHTILCIKGVKEWLDQFGPFLDRICPKCKTGTLVYELVPIFDSS
jgi:hypothetical protein